MIGGLRELLVGSAESLFELSSTKELIDRGEQGAWAQELWAAAVDIGLHQALAAEEQGGAGINFGDFSSVLRVAGRHAAPIPLAEALLGNWLLSLAKRELDDQPLALVVEGRDADLSVRRAAAGFVLDGSAQGVPFARFARRLLFVATVDERARLFEAPLSDCRIEAGKNIAGEARDRVSCDSLTIASDSATELPEDWSVAVIEARWALARVAQMAGALERLLSTTVEYARERVQFGRPIGRFQAVQQQLAVLAGEVAASSAATEAAAEAADRGPALIEIAAAKARVSDAAGRASRIAHQVHGAIGFTHEHELHTRTRRLWAWRSELGSEGEWFAYLGRHFCALGADQMWPELSRY